MLNMSGRKHSRVVLAAFGPLRVSTTPTPGMLTTDQTTQGMNPLLRQRHAKFLDGASPDACRVALSVVE